MTKNLVLESTRVLIEDPAYVRLDKDALEATAQRFAREDLSAPSWDAPVFPAENDEAAIDFFLLANTINFAFTDFDTGEKYTVEFLGTEWKGAFGMYAALKRALADGVPIFDGSYLKQISAGDMWSIFDGKVLIPMFEERHAIFREVGDVLASKYGGRFHNVIKASGNRLFNDGKGLVDRLTGDFTSFDDSGDYKGRTVRFDKRAQLAPAMLYRKFNNEGLFHVEDIDKLTVFADYQLPKALRDLGILVYENSLADRVDTRKLIEPWSQEEMEIRAATIHAADKLVKRINSIRGESPINSIHIDYRLWKEGRKSGEGYHHLTKTIAY